MVIHQGDVFWLDDDEPAGSGPGYRRPHVVVQNDAFNASRIHTAVICSITSHLRLSEAPGNVRLAAGEGGLPRESVVNVSQSLTVDKRDLVEWQGRLSAQRVREIVRGLTLLLEPAGDE